MNAPTWARLLAAAVVALALAGCGSSGVTGIGTAAPSSTEGEYNPRPYDEIRDGGTLTTSLPEISPQFNTFHGNSTTYSRTVWNWYNPLVVTLGPTGEVTFDKDYVTDVEELTVKGNTRITYTINPDAKYNDGTPIDWTSFEAVWRANNATDPEYVVLTSDGYSGITSVTEGRNAKQAVVTFDGVTVWWQALFNTLLHPKALSAGTFNTGYVDEPHPEWGAGPYMLDRYDKQNGAISFVRNPAWWGDRGKLDTRTFLAMDTTARINAFKNGQIDAALVASRDLLAQVQGMDGIEIRKSAGTRVSIITLNGRAPILSDVQVRKAVFEGIDREQLGRIFFQGLGHTAPPPGSLNQFPFQEGYRDAFSTVVTLDAEQARKDLDAAGWVPGPDGVRQKDDAPLEMSYVNSSDDAVAKGMASALAAMMKDIGVNLVIRQVSNTDFSSIVAGREFDMFFAGIYQTDPFTMSYICQNYCSDSQLNLSGTGQPELDAEIKDVTRLPSAEEQYVAGSEVEAKAFRTFGVMPVVNPSRSSRSGRGWPTTARASTSRPGRRTSATRSKAQTSSRKNRVTDSAASRSVPPMLCTALAADRGWVMMKKMIKARTMKPTIRCMLTTT